MRGRLGCELLVMVRGEEGGKDVGVLGHVEG